MKDKLLSIIKYFGINEQLVKLHEEVGELTVECIKDDYFNIVEELADVTILLKQLQYFFEIDNEEIEIMMNEKIDRTLKRIKDGYYGEHR